MIIGNIDFNLNSDLTEDEFHGIYKGKISIPLKDAWKIYSKHKVKVETEKKPIKKKAKKK